QGPSFVFRNRPELLGTLNQHLCRALSVNEEAIIIVGSAKIGFSLAPDNFPRQFSEESDIDVMVVDELLFDRIWLALLKWHYERDYRGMNPTEAKWIGQRRLSLYWGWFASNDFIFERYMNSLYMLREVR